MYRELDDNELIYMINDNQDNCELIFEKYKPLIISICKKYSNKGKEIGYELDDLIQVANIGILDAINTYRDTKNVLFYTYLVHCVKNKLNNELRNNFTNKKLCLNESFSYDAIVPGTNLTYLDIIPDYKILNPFDSLLLQEKENQYISFINSLPFEVAVAYELKNSGLTLDEISIFLELDKKSISKYLKLARETAMSKIS